MIIDHKISSSQCDYLLVLLRDRGQKLKDEYAVTLKCKHLGMDVVTRILSAMEQNNQLIFDIERIKKEV